MNLKGKTMSSSEFPRLVDNLKGLRAVRVEATIDLGAIQGVSSEQLRRNAVRRITETLETNRIDVKSGDDLPTMRLSSSLRLYESTVPNSLVFVYAIELSLREPVAVARIGPQKTQADTWRHQPTLNSHLVKLDESDDASFVTRELKNQLSAFIADWQTANGITDPAAQIRDNLRELISGIGQVFEQMLNSAGVFTLQQLAALTDDEIEVLGSSFGALQDAGESRLKNWRTQARDKLDSQ